MFVRMASSTTPAHPTGEKLTWEEIRARYPDEYVALVDVETPDMTIRAGVVYAHHPDRRTLLAMQQHLRDGAILWTGHAPLFTLHLARNVE